MPQSLKDVANIVGLKVASGPFKGLRLQATNTGDAILAKCLGTYEMEIHPEIEALIEKEPELVVNIGAAEGFYATGLAHRLPQATVLAYEAKPEWRERILRLARLNGVADRIEIHGFCDGEEFQRLAIRMRSARSAAVLMDIEGGEWGLLAGICPGNWKNTSFLIELHEFDSLEKGERLREDFAATHRVTEKWSRPRTFQDIPSPTWRRILFPLRGPVLERLDEKRVARMRWLCCLGGAA